MNLFKKLFGSNKSKNNDVECQRPKCEYCREYFIINKKSKSNDKYNSLANVKKHSIHNKCKHLFNERNDAGMCVKCGKDEQYSYHNVCKDCLENNKQYVGYD